MKCDGYEPFTNPRNVPYNLELATAASSSNTSIWSDSSSQHSDDGNNSDSAESCFSHVSSQSSVSSVESVYEPITKLLQSQSKQSIQQQPQLERKNPRRSSSVASRTGLPPSLVRQNDRKGNFVDNLVDSSTHIVEAIWPTSSVVARNEQGGNTVLPLRTFIQETLRRSRTSYSTLQVALYYLILIKPHVPDRDFTMEQPDDCHANQALQCGRRMFLAALILASKYLQDRNYSARAWSKISGLQVQEINQNEMAFLLAVNWSLHITEEIYNRWTECVRRFHPPQPPAAGVVAHQLYERQCEEFRAIILTLTPELDNLNALDTMSPVPTMETLTRSLYTPPNERVCAFGYDGEVASTPKSLHPVVMEPSPATVYTPGRFAPALGLLPTPRLTPQPSGYSTPAVSAASYLLGKSSMGLAMTQASFTVAAQSLDRWSPSAIPSPQTHFTRRSSLASSVSTASSPESMVSDSSRLSRSSSISSASSVSAPSAKLDVLARCRYAKLCSERSSLKPTFAPVPEDFQLECPMVASPESYSVHCGPYARSRREQEIAEAACALQDLQNHGVPKAPAVQFRGSKRSRTSSIDNSLQENVRELLGGRYQDGESTWSDSFVRARSDLTGGHQQIPVRANLPGSHKRVCCSTEAARPFIMSSLHPAMGGIGGPGMWEGILP